MLVEDDEVEDQSFSAQILVGLQQVGHERYAGVVGHPQQQDRQVPGDAELPEVALTAAIARDRLEVAQPRIAEEQPATETLEDEGVFHRQAEVTQLDRHVRGGQGDGAGNRPPVGILVDQGERGRFAVRIPGGEGEPGGRARGRAGRCGAG